jgi:hypothetical protein
VSSIPAPYVERDAYWYAAAGLGIGILIGATGTIGLYLAGKFL